MSGSSDSDEFYDAEDHTPMRTQRRNTKPEHEFVKDADKKKDDFGEKTQFSHDEDTNYISPEIPTSQIPDAIQNRRRFQELRQRMQEEDDDGYGWNTSPANSQTSSLDGLSNIINDPICRASHPFRVVEHDTTSIQSLSSLGRVGRLLSGSNDVSDLPSNSSEPESKNYTVIDENNSNNSSSRPGELPLQEPDVIASTKSSSTNNTIRNETNESMNRGPVAPPRRKKKGKTNESNVAQAANSNHVSPLVSPASTIESLTREFEHSLDRTNGFYGGSHSFDEENRSKSEETSRSSTIKSLSQNFECSLDIKLATQGQCVVKPQDEDKAKAEGPTLRELERLERLKKELLQFESTGTRNTIGSSSSSSIGNCARGTKRLNPILIGSKERRRSAGDEDLIKQLNMFVRTRTDSGKQLTDMEILEQVTVLNLDTGERVPLSIAEDKLPQCINPLSLHIMRLTSEYVSTTSLEKEKESDEESISSKVSTIPPGDIESGTVRKRTTKLKRFLGSTMKKTVHKAKSIAQEVSHARHKEDIMDIVDEVNPGEQNIKLKASNSHKGPYELENIQHVQELSAAVPGEDESNGGHLGPIWCMKFSACGRLLATAGQDRILRVWVVKDAYHYFQDMRNKYNAEKVSPTPSQESLKSHHSVEESKQMHNSSSDSEDNNHIFMKKPFCTYTGHTSDLLDVSWSKNYFLLSSSMDKTVRLWHISRHECLCCFQHIDFVTAIVFHPRDDRYFLSGSLDGKLRLWNIPDKKVAVWNEVDGQTKLITAANFCQNGKFAVVGSYDGRCIFYNTDQLKYHTQIHVRSTRGRNAIGRKISGIEPMPGEDKILVTSNDSRIRLYDLRDLNLSCKYKGYVNVSSQIKASFSHDGKYIVSGSENRDIYVWKTHHDYSKFSSVRRDRNDFWEAIKAHNAVVTCAVFAPNPDSILKMLDERKAATRNQLIEEEKVIKTALKELSIFESCAISIFKYLSDIYDFNQQITLSVGEDEFSEIILTRVYCEEIGHYRERLFAFRKINSIALNHIFNGSPYILLSRNMLSLFSSLTPI